MEFLHGEIELMAHLLALLTIHLLEFGAGPPQPSVGPLGNGRYHLQIAQQFLEGGDSCGLRFGLHLQKQLRLFENALPDLGWRIPPSGVQLPGLPAREPVPRKRSGHLLTVIQAATR